MRGRWADLLPSIPEGENYLWHTDRGAGVPLFGYRTRYWSFLLKLAKARPGLDIPRQSFAEFRAFPLEKPPAVSPRRWAGCKAFPIDGSSPAHAPSRSASSAMPYRRFLPRSSAAKFGGNCLAQKAKPDLQAFFCGRGRPPAPERVRPVGADYLSLAGTHKAHPGHGRGPGARRRAREGCKLHLLTLQG